MILQTLLAAVGKSAKASLLIDQAEYTQGIGPQLFAKMIGMTIQVLNTSALVHQQSSSALAQHLQSLGRNRYQSQLRSA